MVKRKRAVEVDEDLMVKTMVESLHNDLLREFKRNQQQPVNFYEFVCHPTSFANTVENIFHVSFLIKERKIAMVDSEDSRGAIQWLFSRFGQFFGRIFGRIFGPLSEIPPRKRSLYICS